MKVVIVVFVALLGALIVYLWRQPICPSGQFVRNEADCAASGAFDAGFCRRAFAGAEAIARSSGTVFRDQTACEARGAVCLPHATIASAWVRRPGAWCLANRAGTPALVPLADTP